KSYFDDLDKGVPDKCGAGTRKISVDRRKILLFHYGLGQNGKPMFNRPTPTFYSAVGFVSFTWVREMIVKSFGSSIVFHSNSCRSIRPHVIQCGIIAYPYGQNIWRSLLAVFFP